MTRRPHAHKRGSKGEAGGYGGYRRRNCWGDKRAHMEPQSERDERARRIAEFIARGGRIKRYPLAIADGSMPAHPGGWVSAAERTADFETGGE